MKTAVIRTALIVQAAASLAVAGCIHVDPVEVKPITVNVNVNIHQVDQQLDDFYAFQDKYKTTTSPVSQTGSAPATPPTTP